MLYVKRELDWLGLREMVWSGAFGVVRDIESQGREKDVKERYESIHDDTNIDEPERHYYVGNKVTYEGGAHPELRGHVALITHVYDCDVSVEFIDLEGGLWPDYRFYKSDVVPF